MSTRSSQSQPGPVRVGSRRDSSECQARNPLRNRFMDHTIRSATASRAYATFKGATQKKSSRPSHGTQMSCVPVLFSHDKVRIRQIAQTIHSSFGRENCPCPPHVARVAGNDRKIERRVGKPQRRKEEGKAKSDLRFWYSWRPRVLASWR